MQRMTSFINCVSDNLRITMHFFEEIDLRVQMRCLNGHAKKKDSVDVTVIHNSAVLKSFQNHFLNFIFLSAANSTSSIVETYFNRVIVKVFLKGIYKH